VAGLQAQVEVAESAPSAKAGRGASPLPQEEVMLFGSAVKIRYSLLALLVQWYKY
jgi:hypothetical protein